MSLIVQKFGGSSVRDYAHLLRMARIVKSRVDEGDDVVVVLSAQGDTTDSLLQKAKEISESPSPRELDMLLSAGEQMSAALSEELRDMFTGLKDDATVLVVGLGNRSITSDSLGPRVAERIYVTRHVTEYMPDALPGTVRSVCSVAPGVLGVTGIETMEIVRGVKEYAKPDMIIAIDALASRRAARINTTIQLTDTGISPGSGIGNNRKGLNSEVFGVPVIAIGVPLVVHAATITQEVISLIADKTGLHGDEEKLKRLAEQVISENLGQMVVTPKDIDSIVEDMSGIIATGINMALFGKSFEDVRMLIA